MKNTITVTLTLEVETDPGGMGEAPFDYVVNRGVELVGHTLEPGMAEWALQGDDLWPDTTYALDQILRKLAPEPPLSDEQASELLNDIVDGHTPKESE